MVVVVVSIVEFVDISLPKDSVSVLEVEIFSLDSRLINGDGIIIFNSWGQLFEIS